MTTLNPKQNDVLTELINIGIGRAAATLNGLIGHHIQLHVPRVLLIQKKNLKQYFHTDFNNNIASVIMRFNGSFDGSAALLFPKESASILVSSLTDEPLDSLGMDDLKVGTLTEIGNILINSVMGSMSNMLKTSLNYAVPEYFESDLGQLIDINNNALDFILMAETTFDIGELKVKGTFALFFHVESFETLLTHLDQEIYA